MWELKGYILKCVKNSYYIHEKCFYTPKKQKFGEKKLNDLDI